MSLRELDMAERKLLARVIRAIRSRKRVYMEKTMQCEAEAFAEGVTIQTHNAMWNRGERFLHTAMAHDCMIAAILSAMEARDVKGEG